MNEAIYFLEIVSGVCIAGFFAFYIPGRLIVGEKLNKPFFTILIESLVLGMMVWGVQAFVFGFLQVRYLTYLYLIFGTFLFLKKRYYSEFAEISLRNLDWLAVIVTIIGTIPQTLTFASAGFINSQGLHFPVEDQSDHIWHATLTNELIKRFPPYEPAMYGILLKNYHFWFNLLTADLIRIFNLPLLGTQIIGMYLFMTVLFAAVLYLLGKSIYKISFSRWLLFFWFFSSDAGFIFIFILRRVLSFKTQELIQSTTLFVQSPAFSLAAIFCMFVFYFYFKYRKNISIRSGVITAILFGTLIECKVYIGIPFMVGLWTLSGWDILHKKFSTFFISLLATIIAASIFLPFSNRSSGLVFLPLDRARDFAIQKPFGLSYLDQLWTIYGQHHNIPRLIEIGLIFILIYLFVQFGIRLLGVYSFNKTRKILGTERLIFLYSILACSLILGFFFYQKVGGANIWEFFLASIVVLILISALNLTVILEKRSKISKILIVIIVLLVSLPNWIYYAYFHINNELSIRFNGIDVYKLEADNFIRLSTPKNSIILVLEDYSNPSSLTSIAMGRSTLLSGIGVSQVTTPEMMARINEVKIVKNSKNTGKVEVALKKLNADYIVLYDNEKLSVSLSKIHAVSVFQNAEANVLKIR